MKETKRTPSQFEGGKAIDQRQATADIEENKRLLDEFLSKPENKEQAMWSANQLLKELDGWFNIDQLVRKSNKQLNLEKALNKMHTLLAFGFAVYKDEKGVRKYKIDIGRKEMRNILLQEIEFHKAQLSVLQEKLIKLD